MRRKFKRAAQGRFLNRKFKPAFAASNLGRFDLRFCEMKFGFLYRLIHMILELS